MIDFLRILSVAAEEVLRQKHGRIGFWQTEYAGRLPELDDKAMDGLELGDVVYWWETIDGVCSCPVVIIQDGTAYVIWHDIDDACAGFTPVSEAYFARSKAELIERRRRYLQGELDEHDEHADRLRKLLASDPQD